MRKDKREKEPNCNRNEMTLSTRINLRRKTRAGSYREKFRARVPHSRTRELCVSSSPSPGGRTGSTLDPFYGKWRQWVPLLTRGTNEAD